MDVAFEIESKLLKRNRKHLNQACNTPFASGTLAEYIGQDGDKSGAEAILEGNEIELKDIEEHVIRYIKELKYTSDEIKNTISPAISDEEYIPFWKKKKEKC